MDHFTVIFDMDGVILDSERVYQEIEREMYRELGIAVSREEHLKFMGSAEKAMWGYMHEHYKLESPVEELIREERSRFIERLGSPASIPLMKGILTLLRALRKEGVPCWIASSSSSEIIGKVLHIKRLKKYFRGFVSGEEVAGSKPAPDIFLEAAGRCGKAPEECLVIEDSENGVKAARAAGMKVIALRQAGYPYPGDEDPGHTNPGYADPDRPDAGLGEYGFPDPGFREADLLVKSLSEISPALMRKLTG